MISNLFVPYLELQWVNSYDTHYAYVDGQSSQSSPAFYTPAYYPLSHTFLPHFLSRFLPVVTSASRTPAFYPSRRHETVRPMTADRRRTLFQIYIDKFQTIVQKFSENEDKTHHVLFGDCSIV